MFYITLMGNEMNEYLDGDLGGSKQGSHLPQLLPHTHTPTYGTCII